MILYILIVAGALVCAVQAIRAKRLLISALWLAGSSALVALMMYLLGAPEVAVVELSVGAGLVTVLFVFAINIAGEEDLPLHFVIPRPLSWGLIVASLLLLGWLVLPRFTTVIPVLNTAMSFTQMLWEQRGLDVLVQIALIFTGVLGILSLLSETQPQSDSNEEAHP